MKTEHLQYLLDVIYCGSINKASKKLFLSQQQLSKIIASLEDDFHTTILIRNSKGISLTPEGEKIIKTIRPFLSEINHLQKQFQIKNSITLHGTLCIYKEPSIVSDMVAQFLNDFLVLHPNVTVKIVESYLSNTLHALIDNDAQIAIVHLFESQRHSLPDQLTFIPVLIRTPVVYIATNSDFYRSHHSTSLKALLNEPLIDYSISQQENDSLKALFSNVGVPQIKSSIGNLNSLLDVLREGHMLHVGSKPLKHEPSIQGITYLPIRDKITIIQGLLFKKQLNDDALIKAFLEQYLVFFEAFR